MTTEAGTYTGIGDANVQNTGKMVAAHYIRMAETRAKARALRDALNVGGAALEELGDDDMPTYPAIGASPATAHTAPKPSVVPSGVATQEQLSKIGKLQAVLGCPVSIVPNVTQEEAAAEIAELVKVFNAQSRNGSVQRA